MSIRLEKENLVRMLEEKTLLSEQPFWCAIGLHKWHKWSGALRSASSIYIRQGRYCETCNKYQERKFEE